VFSSQQIFTGIYGLGHYFPLAFAAVAIGVAIAGFLNSRIVGKYGMRVISHAALLGQLASAIVLIVAADLATVPLTLFMVLSVVNLFTFGLMFSNFTALAMEPQGHIAGTASSLFGSMTTLIGIVVGSLIGQFYNETVLPLATGAFLSAAIALVIVMVIEKGRLFVPHNKPV
jgi:DHA1 family bicyclomycin/chloramphenicol resistance-like MFS transporter